MDDTQGGTTDLLTQSLASNCNLTASLGVLLNLGFSISSIFMVSCIDKGCDCEEMYKMIHDD